MTAGDAHARARWARRGDIALRVVASVPLAYATASLWAMALARLLPGDRAEATVTAALIALALCALAAMWAFAARSGWRAIWTLGLAAAVAAAITWISIDATGRV
ncbi:MULTISPECIES: hypothetical protein [Sphingomonas]|jgi:hypothetical protein|uniref:hypothetical protein n=1 Tax=Sphingomonas TaxID=13687 RepID=UPI0006F7964D|nr:MULTISPECIES: hypothetical protein [Sphingomonas]RZM35512.1 MAG: hypothetical protein EOP67_11390 [Sphingomonas sp.]KQN16434.1 hypothetical protein ASE89_07280 [Sphingomonas sp. Leaf30]MBD8641880.1 hypothetical protein [Sphingomonas sp. CFBP 13733]MBD8701948.1 hypothetical protein [Sphingomonas sp. CFBP 13714]NII58559.1 hypothetical protein [Sphingomonas aerolata]